MDIRVKYFKIYLEEMFGSIKLTSLIPPLLIEVPVPSQESEQSCIRSCVLRVWILLLSMVLINDFGNCSDRVVMFVFHLM